MNNQNEVGQSAKVEFWNLGHGVLEWSGVFYFADNCRGIE